MSSISRFLIIPLFFILVRPVFSQTDSTVRIRHIMTLTPARPNVEDPTIIRTVYYLHSSMRRIDNVDANGNISFTKINNCETRAGLIVDRSSREYRAIKLPRLWTEQQFSEYVDKHPSDAVRIESRTVDTGEKKVMFGLTARHFITNVERPTRNGIRGSETIDGWYVEHEQLGCQNGLAFPREESGAILVTYPELPDPRHVGPVPMGLALELTDTIKWTGGRYGESGTTMKSQRVVESIIDAPVDAKTFDGPAGFRENPDLLKPR
jgi:hypothetical protein